MKTYGEVSRNLTTAIFKNMDPQSQNHLIKSMKGPMGKERAGHKYIRRKWNTVKQAWDYIYKDEQGQEHIASKPPEQKEKKEQGYLNDAQETAVGKLKEMFSTDEYEVRRIGDNGNAVVVFNIHEDIGAEHGIKSAKVVIDKKGNYKIASFSGKDKKVTGAKEKTIERKLKTVYGITEGDIVAYTLEDGTEGYGQAVSYDADYWDVDDLKTGKRVNVYKTKLQKAEQIKKPKALSYDELHDKAHEISGGYGFWGALNHLKPSQRITYVKAWVDGLREKGYSDRDIILYGDWRDGRHIADEISGDMGYDEVKKLVKKRAADKEEVKRVNDEDYKKMIEEYGLNEFGKPDKKEQKPAAEESEKYSDFTQAAKWNGLVIAGALSRMAENSGYYEVSRKLDKIARGIGEYTNREAKMMSRLANEYAGKMSENDFIKYAGNALEDANFHDEAREIREMPKKTETKDKTSAKKKNVLFQISLGKDYVSPRIEKYLLQNGFQVTGTGGGTVEYEKQGNIDKEIDALKAKFGDEFIDNAVITDIDAEEEIWEEEREVLKEGQKLSAGEKKQLKLMGNDIGWSRKPQMFRYVKHNSETKDIIKKYKNVIDKLPVCKVDPDENVMIDANPGKIEGMYIIKRGKETYLVDPEGYDYPRYVTRID